MGKKINIIEEDDSPRFRKEFPSLCEDLGIHPRRTVRTKPALRPSSTRMWQLAGATIALLALFGLIILLITVGVRKHRAEESRERACIEQVVIPVISQKISGGRVLEIYPQCDNARVITRIKESPRPKREKISLAPRKVGATTGQQKMIDYAWRISHGDEQFIAMIEAESGWEWKAIEKLDDGSEGSGLGLCQVDSRHWPKIHNNRQFRSDWTYQARTCWKLWEKGVRFYGHDRNNEMIARFWWPSHEEV